jgi:hypothetical protein
MGGSGDQILSKAPRLKDKEEHRSTPIKADEHRKKKSG